MTLPEDLARVLPDDTAATWETLVPVIPPEVYLVGGTAVAVHLAHRISRDLDLVFHNAAVDLDELEGLVSARGRFAVTERSPGTLNGVFSKTKVQFLHLDEGEQQHPIEAPSVVAGLSVAGLRDLLAMKLKVVGDRGELRDYFDLMTIERQADFLTEEGLTYFLARYRPTHPASAIGHIVRGLGFFDDVLDDEALPASRDEIVAYWQRRQPEILRATSRLASE